MSSLNISKKGVGVGTIVNENQHLDINESWKVIGFYPVGSLYFSISSINPTNYFGGTWELYCPGRTIVGVDEDDTNFSTANNSNTIGEKEVTLTIKEIPPHTHKWRYSSRAGSGSNYDRMRPYTTTTAKGYNTSYAGSSQPHNNLQPYITCYIWLRTA